MAYGPNRATLIKNKPKNHDLARPLIGVQAEEVGIAKTKRRPLKVSNVNKSDDQFDSMLKLTLKYMFSEL